MDKNGFEKEAERFSIEASLKEHKRIIQEAYARGAMAIGVPMAVITIILAVQNWQLIQLVTSMTIGR